MQLERERSFHVVLRLEMHLMVYRLSTAHARDRRKLTFTSWWTYLMYISSRPIRRMKFIRRS